MSRLVDFYMPFASKILALAILFCKISNRRFGAKDANKGPKNGVKPNFVQMNASAVERLHDKDADEHTKGPEPTADVNTSTGWNIHVKQKPSDSPKRSQSTVNSIIKSVFKINQGNTVGDDVGSGKKPKINGQTKSNSKGSANDHEEASQGKIPEIYFSKLKFP